MAKQLGQETDAVQWGFVGNRAASHLDQGGQEIGGIDEILVHSLRDFSSPTNHQWHVGSGIGRSPFATHDGTREGFERLAPYDLMGGHLIGAGGFRLDGYLASDEDLLAPPGEGFLIALSGINGARTYVASMWS